MQGVTKWITILLTFVTLNKNDANLVDKKISLYIVFWKYMVTKGEKIKHPKKKRFSHYFYNKLNLKFLDISQYFFWKGYKNL